MRCPVSAAFFVGVKPALGECAWTGWRGARGLRRVARSAGPRIRCGSGSKPRPPAAVLGVRPRARLLLGAATMKRDEPVGLDGIVLVRLLVRPKGFSVSKLAG